MKPDNGRFYQLGPGKITLINSGAFHVAQGNARVGKIACFQFGIVEFRVPENGPLKKCPLQKGGCKTDKVKTGAGKIGICANGPPEPCIVHPGICKIGCF
jgi:hypothetical protein